MRLNEPPRLGKAYSPTKGAIKLKVCLPPYALIRSRCSESVELCVGTATKPHALKTGTRFLRLSCLTIVFEAGDRVVSRPQCPVHPVKLEVIGFFQELIDALPFPWAFSAPALRLGLRVHDR
jgi:hypothetical protein